MCDSVSPAHVEGTMWVAVIITGLLCLWLYRRWTKFSILPSGPRGWPLVGNAFQQDPLRPHITWYEWAEKYGGVMTIDNFGTPTVICSSFEALQEMLVSKSNDFAGRPDVYPHKYITNGGLAVSAGNFSPQWLYMKKVFMANVKMYGDKSEQLESTMTDIISELVEDIQNTKQQPFDPFKPTQLALCNTLALLLLGDKFHNSDSDFKQLLQYIRMDEELSAASLNFFLLDTFPVLHYAPFPYCKLMDKYVNGLLKDWIPRMIQARKVHYDGNSPGCVLDAFLKHCDKDKKVDGKNSLETKHIIALCQDVFTAGMLTSSSTMYAMMAVLTAKPDIQDKVHAEIDWVLGGRPPKVDDRQSMPYFQAMLEEVFRFAGISNALPHKAIVDSSICGHFIPKGTQVWPNIWHLFHDPTVWEEPWSFKPERFLDEKGDFVPSDHPARKKVLVFGAGRRICPAEQLARNRIFLIATSLLQKFEFKPAADGKPPECDPRTYQTGVVFKPQPYMLRAVPRV